MMQQSELSGIAYQETLSAIYPLQSLTGKYRELQGKPCNENREPAMRTGFTVMKILVIAYPKHLILLVVSKYLDEHLLQIDLLVLSN